MYISMCVYLYVFVCVYERETDRQTERGGREGESCYKIITKVVITLGGGRLCGRIPSNFFSFVRMFIITKYYLYKKKQQSYNINIS